MPRFLPVGKDAKGAARFLLAALPRAGRAAHRTRDHRQHRRAHGAEPSHAAFGAFGCAALAVFLGAVAAFGLREGSNEERRVLYAGLAAVGGALVFGVYAGVKTWGDRTQPSITVKPKQGSIVAVSVRGLGLRSSEHIVVEVEQLLRATNEQGRLTWTPGQPLYGASLGPDGAGEIEHTVDLQLPPGDFDDLGARAWVGDEPKPCYARRQSTETARQAEGTQPATQSGALDDAARLRDRSGSVAAKPGRVVARTGRGRRLRSARERRRRARVLGRVCRRKQLQAQPRVSRSGRDRDGLGTARRSGAAVAGLSERRGPV